MFKEHNGLTSLTRFSVYSACAVLKIVSKSPRKSQRRNPHIYPKISIQEKKAHKKNNNRWSKINVKTALMWQKMSNTSLQSRKPSSHLTLMSSIKHTVTTDQHHGKSSEIRDKR